MSGKTTGLTALETRKQLLLVESEINRLQLLNELREFENGLSHLKNQVHEIGSMAASAAKLADTFSSIGRIFSHDNEGEKGKSSWISTLFKSAKVGTSLWQLFRSSEREP
jgi:hypothetical protein